MPTVAPCLPCKASLSKVRRLVVGEAVPRDGATVGVGLGSDDDQGGEDQCCGEQQALDR